MTFVTLRKLLIVVYHVLINKPFFFKFLLHHDDEIYYFNFTMKKEQDYIYNLLIHIENVYLKKPNFLLWNFVCFPLRMNTQ